MLSYRKNLKIRYQPDVLIAGGGPAGIAAALAAARQGCSVHLIEAHTCLGGMSTAGQVPGFVHLSDGMNFLAGGIGKEIYDTLCAQQGLFPPANLCIRAEVLKRIYDELLKTAGVSFTFHTQLIDVTVESGQIREAVCAGKSGLFAIRAKVFVDCTGDGDLCAFAGADYVKGDDDGHMMPGTLCSLWSGVDWQGVLEGNLGWGNRRIEDAFRDGVFTIEDRHLPGMWQISSDLGGGNIGHVFGVDGTDEESLTDAYVWGRKLLKEYERYYKEYLKGFTAMELVSTGSLLGVRETRRITGDYVLSIEDYLRRAVFEDEIGRYSSKVDLHAPMPCKESYENFRKDYEIQMGKGESYGVPYRILTPIGFLNVLVAGRCVSTDRKVNSSLRCMMGCFITGQAAGVAAALTVQHKTDVRGFPVNELQKKLKDMGAYLSNFMNED